MAGFLDPELVRAVCRAPPPSNPSSSSSKTVDERGLTPAMRELVDSKPKAPTPLPKLDCIVGSRIELCGLVGTERNWNNRRGIVTAKHLSMHPQNKNVRAWVLEIAFDKPITKTTFFSDHCRLLNDGETYSFSGQKTAKDKKIKPNEKCPCGSGKKFKKCCAKKVSVCVGFVWAASSGGGLCCCCVCGCSLLMWVGFPHSPLFLFFFFFFSLRKKTRDVDPI